MNVFSAVGNLGGDAETRQTANETPVTNINVAVKTGFGQREQTMWVKCSMFGKRWERLSEYLVKGQAVFVTGELSTHTWTDRGGTDHTDMDLNVTDLQLVGSKPAAQNAHNPQNTEEKKPDFDDDVPF